MARCGYAFFLFSLLSVLVACLTPGPIRERAALVPPLGYPPESGHTEYETSIGARAGLSPLVTSIRTRNGSNTDSGRVWVSDRILDLAVMATFRRKFTLGFSMSNSFFSSSTRSDSLVLPHTGDQSITGLAAAILLRKEGSFGGVVGGVDMSSWMIPYTSYELDDSGWHLTSEDTENLTLPAVSFSAHGHLMGAIPFAGIRLQTVARARSDDIVAKAGWTVALGVEARPVDWIGLTLLGFLPIYDEFVDQGLGAAVGIKLEKAVVALRQEPKADETP